MCRAVHGDQGGARCRQEDCSQLQLFHKDFLRHGDPAAASFELWASASLVSSLSSLVPCLASFYSAESLGTSALLPFFMRAQATAYVEYVLDKELKWLLLDSQNLCEFVRCRPAPLIPLSEDGSTLTLS